MPAMGEIPISVVLILAPIIAFVFLGFFILRFFLKTPYSKRTFEAIWDIEKVVLETIDFDHATQKVVNIVLTELGYLKYGYHVIVLTLLDHERGELRRIAISNTESADKFLKASPIPFQNIRIPLNSFENLSVKAIRENKLQVTSEVADVLVPALPREWVKDFQNQLGIKTTLVYPVTAREKVLGAIIFSLNKDKSKIKTEEWTLLESFVGAVGIALDNALLFRSLNITRNQLAQANARLKELDKLKDDFVSVASHELRTPMTAIKSYLWVAMNKKGAELSEDMKRYLSRAYISVERLINLVNDMLNISRIESGRIALKLSEVNLNELVNEVTEEVGVKAQERGIRVIGLNKQIPKVIADRDKIHEVYLNLIGNSLKFTQAGGTITIDFYEKYPYVFCSVRDTGVGIAPENISRLFTKFGRLENSYVAVAESGGTGLGLFITKSIVNLHKGQITAQSEGLGKGSTFIFSLPVIGTDIAQQLKDEAPKETDETKDLEKTSVNFV
ncbi:hypothetical protein A3D07_02855 [Candidatus Curtissbacteria bacterium RIFCSPHIGHO2_02_FULL_42_15]|uniref:histidine kinase n=1 Tax=Candidatus Curtissbacteria bacterium RIFCSPHIGHO2_02_FULL_42_15 TaxID=1797716 RepID=A0A1F5GDA9_9BACT|nr:MAG: hypothetical protein A3D07_02855 [Candidatus Curtissbacteria bacterium RIFCSPHIGHO2_02_FULL_42_15]